MQRLSLKAIEYVIVIAIWESLRLGIQFVVEQRERRIQAEVQKRVQSFVDGERAINALNELEAIYEQRQITPQGGEKPRVDPGKPFRTISPGRPVSIRPRQPRIISDEEMAELQRRESLKQRSNQ